MRTLRFKHLEKGIVFDASIGHDLIAGSELPGTHVVVMSDNISDVEILNDVIQKDVVVVNYDHDSDTLESLDEDIATFEAVLDSQQSSHDNQINNPTDANKQLYFNSKDLFNSSIQPMKNTIQYSLEKPSAHPYSYWHIMHTFDFANTDSDSISQDEHQLDSSPQFHRQDLGVTSFSNPFNVFEKKQDDLYKISEIDKQDDETITFLLEIEDINKN